MVFSLMVLHLGAICFFLFFFSLGHFSLLFATLYFVGKTCTLLNFGAETCHLHCSSIFPWFYSIFPWCSLISPKRSSIFQFSLSFSMFTIDFSMVSMDFSLRNMHLVTCRI